MGGLTSGTDGSLYFADHLRSAVRRIRPDGIVETIAGNAISGIHGDGGPALTASLLAPSGLVADASGNLYFLDGPARIRRIDRSGIITTVAGTGIAGSLGSDGPAPQAQIAAYPSSLLAGPDGSVYVAEFDESRVRRVTPDDRLVLAAGAPQPPGVFPFLSDGDGGPATLAHIYQPTALTADLRGNIYIGENDSKIRRIAPDGTISTFAGDGVFRTTLGAGDGGPAKSAGFSIIAALASDSQGNVYVGECLGTSLRCRIRRIGTDGVITGIAGDLKSISVADGPAASVRLNDVSGLFVDSKGNCYFADGNPARIRRITPQMTIETISGGSPSFAPDGPDARQAWLLSPTAIAVDRSNNLYVAERCHIRKVSATRVLSTVAGSDNCRPFLQSGPSSDLPLIGDLAVTSQGMIYAADAFGRLFAISSANNITSFPAIGPPPGAVGTPLRLALDSQDRLYLQTLFDSRILRLKPDGTTETFVDLMMTIFPFQSPSPVAIAIDSSDNIYVATSDQGVGTAYRITQDRKISSQRFGLEPESIAVDAVGKLYGTNANGGFIGFASGETPASGYRRGDRGFGGDGGPLASANYSFPSRLIFAPSGDYYFIDSGNERVRRISGSPPSNLPAFPAAGVVNAASGISSAVAPGELITIYGTNLGPASISATIPENNVYPTVAGYTQVLFDGLLAPVLFATATQINAFVPYIASSNGTTSMQVEVDGILSTPLTLNVAKSAFGLFTADSSGSGQGAILNQDNSYNGSSHPADRGSIVVLYGTGEGRTQPAVPDGALVLSTPYSAPDGPVVVTIGGQTAEVLYAGAAPFLPTGILQINARVPAGIVAGDAAIMVSIGGISTTRTVTVAVR